MKALLKKLCDICGSSEAIVETENNQTICEACGHFEDLKEMTETIDGTFLCEACETKRTITN